MAEGNEHLNALLEVLDESLQSDSESESDRQQSQEDLQQHNVQHDDPQPVLHQPMRVQVQRRQLAVLKYISSSSAKRRILKNSNCLFCNREVEKIDLENHLNGSSTCQTLYFRKLHVKTVSSVLCLLYSCLYCDENFSKLFYHLEASEHCKQLYCQRFGLNSSR